MTENERNRPGALTPALALAAVVLILVSALVRVRAEESAPLTGAWRELPLAAGNTATGLGPQDFNAGYSGFVAPVKTGERAVFRARFPHCRYMSVMVYDQEFMPIDSLTDFQLQPRRGVNPFVEGTDRRAADLGEFEVQVLMEDPPAGPRPANTLFAGRAADGKPNRTMAFGYRVYLSDRGLGYRDGNPLAKFGGVPAPRYALLRPDGSADYPSRLDSRFRSAQLLLSILAANAGRMLNPFDQTGRPQSPPRWINEYSRGEGQKLDTYVGNEDTAYIHAPVSDEFGELLVLRWRAARTPEATYYGEPFPDPRQVDLRYFSLTFAYRDPKRMREGGVVSEATVADIDVPTLPDGTSQLVIGFGGVSRPAAVPLEEWVGLRMKRGIIIMRNILVNPEYPGDFGKLAKGEIPAAWDQYTPGGVYCSAAEFAKNPDVGLARAEALKAPGR